MVKNNQTGYWIVLSLIVLGGLYYLHDYTDLFAVGEGEVVFTGYTPYDERINSPILYESNYRIEPNTPMINFKKDTTLPGPYIVCGENTCSGVENGEVNGCMIYKRSYTQRITAGASDDMPYCGSGWTCSGQCGSPDKSYCWKDVTSSETCGGRVIGEDVYECAENTCGGTEQGEDSYGCMTYKKSTTTYPVGSCSGRLYYKKCSCTGAPCSGSTCSCSPITTTVNCGGATTSTCQGDDCYVKGSCDYRSRWTLDSPLKTLTEWKIENPNQEELISKSCNKCPSGVTRYEDDYWVLKGSSGTSYVDESCTKGTVNLPKASGPLKISGSSNKHTTSSGNWALGPNPSITLTTKKNMRDTEGLVRDIKIVATCSGGFGANTGESGSYSSIGPSCSVKIGTNSFTINKEDTLIELFSSKLNPDVADVYVDGRFKETISFTGLDNVDISFIASGGSPTLDIKEFGFLLPFSCIQGPEELLGLETFAGPRSLSIYDTRYAVTKFCTEHPVIITSETGAGSTTTNEVYEKLRRGEVLQIPSTQTWTMFYIFYNDGSLPAVCAEGAFDIERNKCTNLTGIVHFCSEGVFDPAFGACVVTPDIIPVCPYGRYDVAQDKCIYNPPIQAVCELGDYNSVTGLCEFKPDVEGECSI